MQENNNTVMSWTAQQLTMAQHGRTAEEDLTQESFARWDQGFVFDALKAQRYGQSFCNYFGITDNILYYTHNINRCREIIRKRYLT